MRVAVRCSPAGRTNSVWARSSGFRRRGQPLVECLAVGGGTCTIDGQCGLKARPRHGEAAFTADMDRSTLADVALGMC